MLSGLSQVYAITPKLTDMSTLLDLLRHYGDEESTGVCLFVSLLYPVCSVHDNSTVCVV